MKENIENDFGLCKCGCKSKTGIAERNRRNSGWIKGEYKPYIKGHSSAYKKGPLEIKAGYKWCGGCQTIKSSKNFITIITPNGINKATAKNALKGHEKDI